MAARVIERDGDAITIAVTVKVSGPMLSAEEAILTATNEVGAVATAEALQQFDADGYPMILGGVKWYARETHPKYFQCSYGEVIVNRWVYQKAGAARRSVLWNMARASCAMRHPAWGRWCRTSSHK